MARLGSWDIDGYVPTWFDVDNDPGGVWDRDAIPNTTPGPGPVPFVFQMSGADIASDLFFMLDPYYRAGAGEAEKAHRELDLGDYGGRVTFEQFEKRIIVGMEEEQDARDFMKLQEAFDELERMELAERIRKAATVAGITYVVWRLGRLWFGI